MMLGGLYASSRLASWSHHPGFHVNFFVTSHPNIRLSHHSFPFINTLLPTASIFSLSSSNCIILSIIIRILKKYNKKKNGVNVCYGYKMCPFIHSSLITHKQYQILPQMHTRAHNPQMHVRDPHSCTQSTNTRQRSTGRSTNARERSTLAHTIHKCT